MRTNIGNKVILEKNPCAANLDAWDLPLLGPSAQDFLVYMEKGACLVEVEGVHGADDAGERWRHRCCHLLPFWLAESAKS